MICFKHGYQKSNLTYTIRKEFSGCLLCNHIVESENLISKLNVYKLIPYLMDRCTCNFNVRACITMYNIGFPMKYYPGNLDLCLPDWKSDHHPAHLMISAVHTVYPWECPKTGSGLEGE